MDDDNHRLFHRVAEKLGWSEKGGLETAEQQLIKSISKTRRLAVGCHASRGAQDLPPPVQLHLLDSEEEDDRGSGKENQVSKGNNYRTKVFMESSDDDFDQFLVEQATPKTASRKHCSAAKKVSEPVLVLSSDSDDHFEKFLSRVKTPKPKLKEAERGSVDSLKNFVVDSFSSDDDFVAERKKKPTSKGAFKTPKPSSFQTPVRRPLSQCDTPVFLSDSEEDGIVMKSTWGTCHPVHQSPPSQTHKVKVLQSNQKDKIFFPSPSPLLPSLSPSSPPLCSSFTPSPTPLPRRNYSAPSKVEDSASSEEEFLSLLDRIKKNHKTGNTPTPKPNMGNTPTPNMGPNQKPPLSAPQPKASKEVGPRPLVRTPLDLKTPVRPLVTKPTGSQTEYTLKTSSLSSSSVSAAGCQTPGCVSLLSVSDSRLCFSPQRVRLQAVFLSSACQLQGVRLQAVFLSPQRVSSRVSDHRLCFSLRSVSAAGCQTPGCVSLLSVSDSRLCFSQRVSSRVSDTRLCFSPQRVRLQAVFLSSACQQQGVRLQGVSSSLCQDQAPATAATSNRPRRSSPADFTTCTTPACSTASCPVTCQ
ncbi:serine/arginine repetitive matrix protein 1 isoform X11 [Salmo trutta]|uniref:serine/arginine repetitive matrix protein 1 isoform X11 n=1 Tax=Salmo trutta TaxID=8032 RepID=UPI0011307239|nr:serine/arginine repetitive matrix protein 1-like isoform X11 [Salmo trutta]